MKLRIALIRLRPADSIEKNLETGMEVCRPAAQVSEAGSMGREEPKAGVIRDPLC